MSTIDLSTINHHPAIEEISGILAERCNNTDRRFFRIVTAYYLAKMAGSMQATIRTNFRGTLPVNIYAVALAPSGFGKGTSTDILEQYFLKGFERRFLDDTFPVLADQHIWKRAIERAALTGNDEQAEKDKLDKEFMLCGNYVFTFSKATPAAIQQIRQKLLLAECGSINLWIDEIGSNIIGATDVLNVFLELYDKGKIKQSVTKNTHESIRAQEIDGTTPTNALMFGTPDKLLDGGLTEDHFFSFLDTGYSRRCIYAWGERDNERNQKMTEAERYAQLTKAQKTMGGSHWANHFALLADPSKFGWEVSVDDTVGTKIVGYQMACENQARALAPHEGIRKAELEHRHDRALKLAGALAFVDESTEITLLHFHQAMKIVEESGEAFNRIMVREKPYVKLAKYISSHNGTELTHADLDADLPYYKSGTSSQDKMMQNARAWAYKNHIILRKRFEDGIELFSGEMLKETNLNEMMVSYSTHYAYNYNPDLLAWDSLHELAQFDPANLNQGATDFQWCNHRFTNEHRSDENTIAGFNMAVFDFDGGVSLDLVHDLLSGYRFMTYTTKRHSPQENRFRLILPINYILALDKKDYKLFIEGMSEWLPFPANLSDEASKKRSQKWLSCHTGSYHYGDGDLIDCLPFIPKTANNELYRSQMQGLQSLDNLERWFAQRIADGNRNNQMIKFALALVDSGMAFSEVEQAVFAFNNKLDHGMDEDELRSTILVTVAKKIAGNP